MDINILKTFLEVCRTCHFGKAATRYKFLQHAEVMLNEWNQTKIEINTGEKRRLCITAGATPGFRDICLAEWIETSLRNCRILLLQLCLPLYIILNHCL